MGWIAHDNATLVTLGDTATFTHESGELWAMIGLISITVMMAKESREQSYSAYSELRRSWALSVNDPYNEDTSNRVLYRWRNDCVVNGNFVAGVPREGTAEWPTKVLEFVGMPTET